MAPTEQTTPKAAQTNKSKMINPWVAVIIISLITGSLSGAGAYYLLGTTSRSSGTGLLSRQTTVNPITINSTNEDSPIIDVAQKSVDSVVSIVASREVSSRGSGSLFDRFFEDLYGNGGSTNGQNGRRQVSAGTGFLVTSDGYIITNRHVVDDTAANFTVIFNNGVQAPAKVIDRDTVLDIAFVKVEKQNFELKPLPLGVSTGLEVGQTAIAIGNSLGEFSNTVSKGIISGLNRSIQAGDSFGGNVENLENIIQTDASINSGNSGGPLLDASGNVIGINVAKAQDGENIGFAIPIDVVKPVLDSVIRSGKIVRPYIGVRFVSVTPALATSDGLGRDYGALLRGTDSSGAVVRGSPADKAGLKAGDIILAVNNEKVSDKNNLRSLLNKYGVGETITLRVFSDNNEKDVRVTLEELPRN